MASGQCLHLSAFVHNLVNNDVVIGLLDEIYRRTPEGKPGWLISGAGGDFCSGSTWEFQKLHSDMSMASPIYGRGKSKEKSSGKATPLNFAEAPIHDMLLPPRISVNYIVQDQTPLNGPTRIVPWSEMVASARRKPPSLEEEYRLFPHRLASKILHLHAGDCVVRDIRVWHGGCPNLSGEARFLPSIEVSSAAWAEWRRTCLPYSRHGRTVLPLELWKSISPMAQERCQELVSQDCGDEVNDRIDCFSWLKKDVTKPARDPYKFWATNQLTKADQVVAVAAHKECCQRM